MELSAPILMIVASLVVLAVYFRVGRVKTWREFVLIAAGIIGIGLWMLRAEMTTKASTENLVETLFNIDSKAIPLVLRRHSARGAPTARIEAIYKFSLEEFNRTQDRPPSLERISLSYRPSAWKELTIDRFDIAAGALDWNEFPRALRMADGFRVERGHHSRQRTPNERDMSGRYVCAFIPIDKEADGSVAAYQVLPCSSVRTRRPSGITILGLLNRNDHTLHVLIR